MRKLPLLVSILLSLSLCPLLRAQDPNKIIDQYLKAAGGAKALSKVQTVSIEGAFATGADGKSGAYTLKLKQPNRYYSEIHDAGQHPD